MLPAVRLCPNPVSLVFIVWQLHVELRVIQEIHWYCWYPGLPSQSCRCIAKSGHDPTIAQNYFRGIITCQMETCCCQTCSKSWHENRPFRLQNYICTASVLKILECAYDTFTGAFAQVVISSYMYMYMYIMYGGIIVHTSTVHLQVKCRVVI